MKLHIKTSIMANIKLFCVVLSFYSIFVFAVDVFMVMTEIMLFLHVRSLCSIRNFSTVGTCT